MSLACVVSKQQNWNYQEFRGGVNLALVCVSLQLAEIKRVSAINSKVYMCLIAAHVSISISIKPAR
jgi:hypothetical protein